MPRRPPLPPDVRQLLGLARRDREAAREALAALPVDAQVALVCRAPASRRAALLELLDAPEKIVPRLPEAELCFTVKAIGLGDAGWILEHASAEQLASCLDLDAWCGEARDRAALGAWLDALGEAGDEALLRAAHALDPELLVLALRDRVEVHPKPADDPDWRPPPGSESLEGQFYLRARREGDDLAALLQLLRLLFEKDYWLYFRLLQGAIWESTDQCEEWAARWRSGRLQDLGFPPREEAVAIYARLESEQRTALPEGGRGLAVPEWRLPVWLPELPADARHAVFRAAAELREEERRAFFYALVSLANRVAVADRLPLSDAESIPRAVDKAAELASLGLEQLAREHALPAAEVLRRAPLERLFRVGASLRGPEVLPPPPESPADAAEEE